MLRTTRPPRGLGLGLGLFVGLGLVACGGEHWQEEVPPVEAWMIRLPQMAPPRAHPLSDTTGWVYLHSRDAAALFNGWTSGLHGAVVWATGLAREESSSADGIWGPWPDPESRDITWRLRAGIDATHLEVATDVNADEWRAVVSWSGDARSGSVALQFDAFADVPDLGLWIRDAVRSYSGTIEVDFDVSEDPWEQAVLDVRFEDFEARDTMASRTFMGDEPWRHSRTAGEGGDFYAVMWQPFDGLGFTGPGVDRMGIGVAWADDESGRAQGRIVEGDLVAESPLVLDECFDAAGRLTYRSVTEGYLEVIPEYPLGSADVCPLDGFVPTAP